MDHGNHHENEPVLAASFKSGENFCFWLGQKAWCVFFPFPNPGSNLHGHAAQCPSLLFWLGPMDPSGLFSCP